MKKSALLVVDMLADFFVAKKNMPPALEAERVLKNNRKAIDAAREAGIPVVFVNDSFQKTEIPIDRHFKMGSPHAIEGTDGAKVAGELGYDPERDFVVPKKLYDGFYNTRLDSILREMDIKECVVTGTWTYVCVQHTAMGAWCRGYDVVALSDSCSGPDLEMHQNGLAYMKKWYAAEVIDTDTWIARIRKG